MNAILMTLLIAVIHLSASGQTNCTCNENFDRMVEKIETNYVAFHLDKTGNNKRYQEHKKRYRALSKKTSISNCTQLLNAFTSFFKDGHLFVIENPEFDQAILDSIKKKISAEKMDIDFIANYLATNKQALHPMEGIWTDGSSKFAITRDTSSRGKSTFKAIILESSNREKIGEVKMKLVPTTHKSEGVYYSNSYAPRHIMADLYKDGTLLCLSGGIYWGKINFNSKRDIDSAHIFQPKNPTLQLIYDKFAVISLPSFLVEKSVLDQLLIDNIQTLSQVPYWIIDIRGNIGGNAIYFGLISGYYEKPAISEQPGFAIASSDNLAYFSNFGSQRGSPYEKLIKSMKDSMGQLVQGPVFGNITLTNHPTAVKKVVILTDRSNMSAAETFVLHSKAMSTKVITMGDYTGGVVDYNNINMITLGCSGQNIILGYPTYSRTGNLEKNGYNKTGIKPDVLIGRDVKDKIGFIKDFIEKQ